MGIDIPPQIPAAIVRGTESQNNSPTNSQQERVLKEEARRQMEVEMRRRLDEKSQKK